MMTELFLRTYIHLCAFSRAIRDGSKLEKLPVCTSNVAARYKVSKMKMDERKTTKTTITTSVAIQPKLVALLLPLRRRK